MSGQISSDIRGLELQIIIAFVSGAIAAGFLDALGSDLYDGLKAGLKRLLLKHEASASQNEEPLGRLTIEYPPHVPTFLRDQPPALEVEFLCVFYSAEDLEGFLSTLPRASKLVEEAWSSKLFPFDIDSYRYSVSLEPGMSGCRVNITRRSDSDTTPKITESCLVYLDARKLTLEHWREEFRSMLLRRTAPNSKAVTRVTKDAK